jgi:hypothetical protein
MAFAALIGPLISGIASIAGAAMSASAMNSQAAAEEEAAAYNAARQREEAARRQSMGALESDKKAKEYDQASATARAAMAQGGVATTEGSPLLVQQEFAADKFFNQNVVMNNARNEQRDLMNKASITEYEGAVKASSLRAQAGAGLLSGVAGAVKGIGGAFG